MSFWSNRLLSLNHLFSSQAIINRTAYAPAVYSINQTRNYAARKGTRERKRKAKVKVEIKKVGFIPENVRKREAMAVNRPSKKIDDSMKADPVDNVYPVRYYKWIVYPFIEAVKAHRETHHPDMYNKPDAPLFVTIDLNMQGEKKTRMVDNFSMIVPIAHQFDHGENRSIIAFAKNYDSQAEARESGAQLAGGVELVKDIEAGKISIDHFQYAVAHPDIMHEVLSLRGIMKKKFPHNKAGTINTDLSVVVKRILHGIKYQAVKDLFEKDFGQIDVSVGTLDMNEKHLEENFSALIKDVYSHKPKRPGSFILRCMLWSPPSRERLKIDHEVYLQDEKSADASDDENDDNVKEDAVTL